MVDIKSEGRNMVVTILGDIDHHSAAEIKTAVDNYYDRQNAKNICFDFGKVGFMDSSGIGMIMGRYKNVQKQGGKVVLANIKPQLQRIFELSGLQKIIKTFGSVKLAIASFTDVVNS